jgi:hypothetical protein
MLHIILSVSVLFLIYKLTLSDQAQVSLSDLVQRILAGLPLLGNPEKNFHLGRNPLLAALFPNTQ